MYMTVFVFTGSGQFGSVAKGECTLRNGSCIPVAVKTLKNEDIGAKEEVKYNMCSVL
jgi:hypothetical protein